MVKGHTSSSLSSALEEEKSHSHETVEVKEFRRSNDVSEQAGELT